MQDKRGTLKGATGKHIRRWVGKPPQNGPNALLTAIEYDSEMADKKQIRYPR